MTLEDHLRLMIGDLVFTAARLSAENDKLRESAPTAPPAEPPSEKTDDKEKT